MPKSVLMKWIGRIVSGLVLLVVVVLVFTAVRASILDNTVFATLPPDSQLVDIGERNIHLIAQGVNHSGPAVVLLPCLGCGAVPWQAVQPAVAEVARVYAYNPAGFAWSDPHPELLDPARSAADLSATLQALGEDQVILVAFSGSGITTLYYLALADAPAVAGIVWVEGDGFSAAGESLFTGSMLLMPEGLQRALIELGVGWVVYEVLMEPLQRATISDEVYTMLNEAIFEGLMVVGPTRQSLRAATDVSVSYAAALDAARTLSIPADMPVFALDADWEPDFAFMPDDMAATERSREEARAAAWQALAAAHPAGRYIPVANSGHMIPLEQPQIVVDAIRDMVALVADE